MTHDENQRARASRDERRRRLSRLSTAPSSPPAWLGRVTTATASINVGKFFAARPVALLGTESEGSSGTATDQGTADRAVYLVGPGTPAQNDQVVVRWADWRWVASRRGTAGGGGTCSGQVCITVSACDFVTPLAGATVTLIRVSDSAVIGAATTNSSGVACVSYSGIAAVSHRLEVAKTNYATSSGVPFTPTCNTQNFTRVMVQATGYACCGIEPVHLPTITMTYGCGTLTLYQETNLFGQPTCAWSATVGDFSSDIVCPDCVAYVAAFYHLVYNGNGNFSYAHTMYISNGTTISNASNTVTGTISPLSLNITSADFTAHLPCPDDDILPVSFTE